MLTVIDQLGHPIETNISITEKPKKSKVPFMFKTPWYNSDRDNVIFGNSVRTDEELWEELRKLVTKESSDDPHVQHTNYDLCRYLISLLGNFDNNDEVLIIANLEILFTVYCYYKYYKLDISKIYYASSTELKQCQASHLISESNILTFTNLNHPKNMYFTKCITNLPFQNPKGAGNGEPLYTALVKRVLPFLDPKIGMFSGIMPPVVKFKHNGMDILLNENITYMEIETPKLKESFKGVGSQFSILVIKRSSPYRGVELLIGDEESTFNVDYRKNKEILICKKEAYSIFEKVDKKFLEHGTYPIEWGCGRGRPDNVSPLVNIQNWKNLKKDEINYDYSGSYIDKFPFRIMTTLAHHNKNEYHWSSRPGLAFYEKKVIYTDVANCKAFYDEGTLAIGQHCRAIIVNSQEEANIIINVLNSKLITFLSKAMPASGSAGGIASVILRFPKITEDIDLYNFFEFSSNEIAMIEQG